jgi:hypothetical protein
VHITVESQGMVDDQTFEYRATLRAEQHLPDCFYVLTFGYGGQTSHYAGPIGTLRAGAERRVRVRVPRRVEHVGVLHVFSRGDELPTNLHDFRHYNLREEMARLARPDLGVPFEVLVPHLVPTARYALSPDGRLVALFARSGERLVARTLNLRSRLWSPKLDLGPFVHAARVPVPGGSVSLELVSEVTANYWPAADRTVVIVQRSLVHLDQLLYRDQFERVRRDVANRMFEIDWTRGQVTELLAGVADIEHPLPARHEQLLLRMEDEPRYVCFNLATRQIEQRHHVDDRRFHYLFDGDGEPRLRAEDRGGRIVFGARAVAGGRWAPLDAATGEPELRFD